MLRHVAYAEIMGEKGDNERGRGQQQEESYGQHAAFRAGYQGRMLAKRAGDRQRNGKDGKTCGKYERNRTKIRKIHGASLVNAMFRVWRIETLMDISPAVFEPEMARARRTGPRRRR